MRISYLKKNRISGCLALFALAGVLSGCGVDKLGLEESISGNGTLQDQLAQPPLTETEQAILQYEEKYAAGEADAADLRTLADLYGQTGMVLRQRDLLEQSYRLFADDEALVQLETLTVNVEEENTLVKETAQQLLNNLGTDGYLDEGIAMLQDEDWFSTMMPKLTVGQRRYYLEEADGTTLCVEVGYDEAGSPYSAVWLTTGNAEVLHLLKQTDSVYLLRTGLAGGTYQGAFETWLCLSSTGDVYHEQGFFNNGISVGEYSSQVFFGSAATDLLSLWCNRNDFDFTSYYGEFNDLGKTMLTQPSSLEEGEVAYAYDASGKKYLTMQAKEASEATFDCALLGLKAYPAFTPYEAKQPDFLAPAEAAQIQIRIYDSNIEWFDGSVWHIAGSVDEYAAVDPLKRESSASLPADDETQPAEPDSQPQRGSGSTAPASTTPSSPAATSKPSQTAKPTPTPEQPETPAQTPAQTQTPAPTPTPTPTPTPNPTPTPDPTPTPTPTPDPTPNPGDGSDIEWSPDLE